MTVARNQMVVSVAHKLRLLHEGFFPGFEFMSFAPALSAEQVRRWGSGCRMVGAVRAGADGNRRAGHAQAPHAGPHCQWLVLRSWN